MPYSCWASSAQRQRIVHLHRDAERLELAHDVDDLGVADVGHVLLEGQAEHRHASPTSRLLPKSARMHSRATRCADAVVDAPAGQDDLRMIAGLLGAVRQVIGIDADAVPADEARRERQEVPLGARRRQHVAGVDAEHVARSPTARS